MWLIDTITLKLKEFPTEAGLQYAILSHRWEDDEVLFRDLDASKDLNLLRDKRGFSKVKGCCDQASRDQYSWAWVDTCCIDKSSSAELSEAINSMFHWYRESAMCYVYLSDVDSLDDIGGSEWFKRGWTLQELLAPTRLQFFGREWNFLSDKRSLLKELRSVTSIPENALLNFKSKDYCVAQKMSWAAGRQTTREEDIAYCLMGIFDINMPLLYGERTKAFWRLQETIMESSTDLSILFWEGQPCAEYALLAASPSCFFARTLDKRRQNLREMFNISKGWTRNNAGVSIQLSLLPHHVGENQNAVFIAVIHEPQSPQRWSGYGIFLERPQQSRRKDNYRRVSVDNKTTISIASFVGMVVYSSIPEFVTNLLITREPMTSSSSAGSNNFHMVWTAPESLQARVCQRSPDRVDGSFEHWPVIATELATVRSLSFNYQRIEAQGILGHLLVNISNSLRLLVCFGFDVRFRPACVVVICDEQFYNDDLTSRNVMSAYYNLFGNTEEDHRADGTANIHAIRTSEHLQKYGLFDNTIFLSLDADVIELDILPQFLKKQKWRSRIGVDTLIRQRERFRK